MGRPAARLTDFHVCPRFSGKIPHVGGPILPKCETTVLIGGLPAARVSDKALCIGPTDMIAKGSATVLIGGKPAARLGDRTAHGGRIVQGEYTVLIGDLSASAAGLAIDYAPGAANQIKAMEAAKDGAMPFCEVCNLDNPGVEPESGPLADHAPGQDNQVDAFLEAKKHGTPLVDVCPPAQGKSDDSNDLIEGKIGYSKDYDDTKLSPSIKASHTWFEKDASFAKWGDDDSFVHLGEGKSKLFTGIEITKDATKVVLIEGQGSFSVLHAQKKVEGEHGVAKGEVTVGKLSGDALVGFTHKDGKTRAGLELGLEAVAAEVSGEAAFYIPLPFTDKKIVLGVGGEASVGAKAKLTAVFDQNEKHGTHFKWGAKFAAGLGLGFNFILGIK